MKVVLTASRKVKTGVETVASTEIYWAVDLDCIVA